MVRNLLRLGCGSFFMAPLDFGRVGVLPAWRCILYF
jgi:hypothetical protein